MTQFLKQRVPLGLSEELANLTTQTGTERSECLFEFFVVVDEHSRSWTYALLSLEVYGEV